VPPPARMTPVRLLVVALLAAACTGPAGGAEPEPVPTRPPVASTTTTTTTPPPPTAPPRPVTLAFGGDVHFEGVLATRLADGPAAVLDAITPVLRSADLAMVNLETAVTTGGSPAGKEFVFRAPPSAFTALRAAGIDVATMANNHGMDYGERGLRDSLAAAEAAGFPVVGIGLDAAEAFRARTFTVRDQRVAVLGATQVLDSSLAAAWTAGEGKPGLASAVEPGRLLVAVRLADRAADTVVVFLHWGQERNPCPLPRQRQLAADLAEAGADVVVGSHAHVLLGGGMLDGTYVHYGLGNFVFYSGGPSGVLQVTVRDGRVERARWRPATIVGGTPRPLTGPAAGQAVRSWERLRGCTGLDAG
jgi:poly-gamma-glutamate capsule biosynthesis protein CapA/YwtB (metallophosphatase superfamily)